AALVNNIKAVANIKARCLVRTMERPLRVYSSTNLAPIGQCEQRSSGWAPACRTAIRSSKDPSDARFTIRGHGGRKSCPPQQALRTSFSSFSTTSGLPTLDATDQKEPERAWTRWRPTECDIQISMSLQCARPRALACLPAATRMPLGWESLPNGRAVIQVIGGRSHERPRPFPKSCGITPTAPMLWANGTLQTSQITVPQGRRITGLLGADSAVGTASM